MPRQTNLSDSARWRDEPSTRDSDEDPEETVLTPESSKEASSGSEDSETAGSDAFVELLGTKQTPNPLHCRFSYLDCTHRPFKKPRKWVEHMLFHFRAAGPPLEGATCRYCDYQPMLEDLKDSKIVKVLQAHKELPEGDWPLNATELASVRYQFGKAKRPDQYPYQNDARVSAQAKALWYFLHKHVLEHHTSDEANKVTSIDSKMIKYLYQIRVVGKPELKALESGGKINEGISTTPTDTRGRSSRGL